MSFSLDIFSSLILFLFSFKDKDYIKNYVKTSSFGMNHFISCSRCIWELITLVDLLNCVNNMKLSDDSMGCPFLFQIYVHSFYSNFFLSRPLWVFNLVSFLFFSFSFSFFFFSSFFHSFSFYMGCLFGISTHELHFFLFFFLFLFFLFFF